MAASMSSRLMPSTMSGLLAIDFSVMCWTRSYTNPCRMSPVVCAGGSTVPDRFPSSTRPSGVSAST
jgi:hypothetical protein